VWFAQEIRKAIEDSAVVPTVDGIKTADLAESYLNDGVDVITCERWFQENSELVNACAKELGVDTKMVNQIGWGFGGCGKSKE
jgi:hypothetical protein